MFSYHTSCCRVLLYHNVISYYNIIISYHHHIYQSYQSYITHHLTISYHHILYHTHITHTSHNIISYHHHHTHHTGLPSYTASGGMIYVNTHTNERISHVPTRAASKKEGASYDIKHPPGGGDGGGLPEGWEAVASESHPGVLYYIILYFIHLIISYHNISYISYHNNIIS